MTIDYPLNVLRVEIQHIMRSAAAAEDTQTCVFAQALEVLLSREQARAGLPDKLPDEKPLSTLSNQLVEGGKICARIMETPAHNQQEANIKALAALCSLLAAAELERLGWEPKPRTPEASRGASPEVTDSTTRSEG